jgi:2-oxoglutarate ferredoxin oxidoreductase subunit alpha
MKLGLLQLLTLWPFPRGPVEKALTGRRAAVVPELNMGQIRREVLRVNDGRTQVLGLPKMSGRMITPDEILVRLREVK